MQVTTRMRIVGATLAVGVGLAMTLPGSAASAGESCDGTVSSAPDARIKVGSGPFVGNGAYPGSAVAIDGVDIGEQATFTMKFKNKSGNTATIRLREISFDRSSGFTAKYFANGIDVTQKIRDGKSIKFANVAANASTPDVLFVVKNKSNPNPDDGALSRLSGRYAGSELNDCDGVLGVVNFPA